MRTILSSLLVLLAFVGTTPARAAVGESYSDLFKSEFGTFFNLSEVSSMGFGTPDAPVTLHSIKTGGFKEHIDIKVYEDKAGTITGAVLVTSRSWIGSTTSINPFAKDVIKSFVEEMVPKADASAVAPIITAIWKSKGTADNVVTIQPSGDDRQAPSAGDAAKFLKVFLGQSDAYEATYKECTLKLSHREIGGVKVLVTTVEQTGK